MLLLNHRPSNKSLTLAACGAFLGLLGYCRHFCFFTIDHHSPSYKSERLPPATENSIQTFAPVPAEYGVTCGSAERSSQLDTCLDTASAEYLRELRKSVVEHCSPRSGEGISCFHGTTNGHDHDLFCIAHGVVLDKVTKRFSFECDSGLSEKESARDVFDSDEMQRQSGPSSVFDKYFDIGLRPKGITQALLQVEEYEAKQSNYTISVKRQGIASFWDSLMEIMSMMLSVDVLRMSSNIRLGDSFIKVPADMPRTQVIILDDLPEGPLFDLWSFFAGSAPIRFRDIIEDKARADALLSAHTVIVPLPGDSNPLSQIDRYNVSSHRYSALVRTFARRVLQNYGVLYPQGGSSVLKVVRVTLIARTGTREIRDTDHLLEALRGAFPNVLARAVDLAAIPMASQLQIMQSTDVLVGVHGAGLSHIMFMREGEGAVVEIQPAELPMTQHLARYKHLAAMLGLKYFLAEAEVVVPLGQVGSGRADVEHGLAGDRLKEGETELARRNTELKLSADEFVAQVGRAIETLVVQS